jgi:hypothetical protein
MLDEAEQTRRAMVVVVACIAMGAGRSTMSVVESAATPVAQSSRNSMRWRRKTQTLIVVEVMTDKLEALAD